MNIENGPASPPRLLTMASAMARSLAATCFLLMMGVSLGMIMLRCESEYGGACPGIATHRVRRGSKLDALQPAASSYVIIGWHACASTRRLFRQAITGFH